MKLPFGLTLSRTKAAVGASSPFSDLLNAVREGSPGAWQNGTPLPTTTIGGITSFGAVFACIARIANDIAKLPPRLLKQREDGTWALAAPNSPYWTVLRRPNAFQNRIQFAIAWLVSKLLFGNAYAIKIRDLRGIVTQLFVLDPRGVTPLVTPEGDVYYSLSGSDLAQVRSGMVVPASEMIHDRGVTLWHPLVGVSPIYACSASVQQGQRIQTSSSKFFENMSRPSGMLTAPGTIDDVTAGRLKAEWERNYAGLNVGRLAILGDGLKYEAMTIPADDAQLLEQLAWTVEDVARAFAVPLYKISAGPMPTAGNVEALELQYYTGCLQILIESMELCLDEGLGLPTGYGVELDLSNLQRMDSMSQIDMLVKSIGGALMSPDEARALRNLPPTPGGKSVYLQQQNYSLEALARRDETAFETPPPAPPAPPPQEGAETGEDEANGAPQDSDEGKSVAAALEALLAKSQQAADEARAADLRALEAELRRRFEAEVIEYGAG